jgi:hypothetical protein
VPQPEPVTLIKTDADGRPKARYRGHIVRHEADVVVARCPWTLGGALDLGGVVLEPGDVLDEYYYPGRWFNVFRMWAAGGRLKGWYCNVTYPPEIRAQDGDWEILWRDLALDLLVFPDGTERLLDEDEFEALSPSAEVRARAAEALATLRAWLAAGREPFEGWIEEEG